MHKSILNTIVSEISAVKRDGAHVHTVKQLLSVRQLYTATHWLHARKYYL